MSERLRVDVVNSCRGCRHLHRSPSIDKCTLWYLSSNPEWTGTLDRAEEDEVHKLCPLPTVATLSKTVRPIQLHEGVEYLLELPPATDRIKFVKFAAQTLGFNLQGGEARPFITIPLKESGAVRLSSSSIVGIVNRTTAYFEALNQNARTTTFRLVVNRYGFRLDEQVDGGIDTSWEERDIAPR